MHDAGGPSGTANSINKFLERIFPLLSPMGVALGVLLPGLFIHLRPIIPWLFGTITLSGALKLRVRELGRAASSPLPIIFYFLYAHVVIPLLIFLLSTLIFKNDPDSVTGFVLLYSVPTAVTAFIWISIFRGDSALSLALILLDAILAPLVIPATVRLLLGTSVHLDMTAMAFSLFFMIVIPTILGVVLNELSRGKIPAAADPWLSPFSKVCMVMMIASNSASVAPQIRPNDPHFWIIALVCIGFIIMNFISARLMGIAGKFGREKQVSLFFASGLRNTSAAMTLGTEFFPAAAALPPILGIMLQQITAGIFGRILLRGKKDD